MSIILFLWVILLSYLPKGRFSSTSANTAKLPFNEISDHQVNCSFKGMDYNVTTGKGVFSEPGNGIDFRITPEKNILSLYLAQKDLMK